MNTLCRVCYLVLSLAIFGHGAIGEAAAQPVPGGDPRIDPDIRWAIYLADRTLASPDTSSTEKAAAQAALDEKIDVIFDYSAPVPLLDLAAFVNYPRGEIRWIFRTSYGWTGTVARGKIPEVVAALSSGFRAVLAARQVTIDPPPQIAIQLMPLFTVEVAPAVDGPFTLVPADIDDQAQTVTLSVEQSGERFFRIQAAMELTLTNPKTSGDKLIFGYETR